MKIEEVEDRKATELEAMAQNIAMLATAVQTLNDVVLVLAKDIDVNKLPDWKTKEEIEKDVGPKIQKCIELVRKTYGPSEADKS